MEAGLRALRNVKTVRLVDIPTVNILTLRAAFLSAEEGLLRNASKFDELKELKELKDMQCMVSCRNEFMNVSAIVTELVISSNCCNEKVLKVLNVRELILLTRLEIGDECFEHVNEVKLIGLKKLESVVIGKKSFTKHTNEDDDPKGHFYLKDCEKLKELKIGCESFNDYSVCEITNVPSLEVIEVGEVNVDSYNFYWASLELKSDGDEMK